MFGSAEWLVPHDKLDAAKLSARYSAMDQSAPQIREALAQRMADYRMTAQDIKAVLARVTP